MTFLEFSDQFFRALAGCFFAAAIPAGVGLGLAMDVSALASRDKRAKAAAAGDIAAMGGQEIAVHYAVRWWCRRKRRLRKICP